MGDPNPEIAFQTTHRVGAAPLETYERPDAASVLAARLDPQLGVQVIEQRADGWAHVACSNGWTTWVDGRRLAAAGAAQPVVAAEPFSVLLPLLGCACIVFGTLAPWYEADGGHVTGWRLPVQFLVTRTPGFTEPRIALFLLPGALIAAVGAFRVAAGSRQDGRWLMLIGGSAATNLGTWGLMRWLHPAFGLGIGLGAPLTLAGGTLVMVAFMQTRDRNKEGPWAFL